MKSAFLDKLIERLDRLDSASLEAHFLRLARERGLLETIFNAIHEGIVVLDDHGRITYANRAAEELLGFDVENAAGDPIARYLSGIDWPLLLQLDEGEWSRVMSREIEISYPRRRFLQFYLVPLGVVDSTEGGAVLILRDVTRERERANQELESERLRAITLLSGSLAHEIGNPLNSLNIHLQLLRREIHDLPPEERQRLEDLVRVAGDEVARLDSIISQFLRAVRPAPPKLEPTDLRALLEDTIEFMKPEISNRDVIVHLDAPDDLPAASADRVQMRQAFFNIIKNAVQAMCAAAEEALRRCRADISQVACIIPHQANRRIIDAVAARLKAKPDQVYVNLDRYGNTSAASVAIALDEAARSGRIQRGDLALLTVFGGGFTWGSALLEW